MNVTYKMSDKLVWIATVFLFSSITIFESYTWGKYILILACLFILFVDVLEGKAKYHYTIGAYHYFMCILTVYTFLSSIWGISAKDSLTKTFTYIQILICMSIVYNHFNKFDNVTPLIEVVKWSSYVISIYSIMYYGLNFVISMMTSGVRLDNSYSNINTIGMLAAFGIIIQIDDILREKKIGLETIFCVPAFMMAIATQSRKALLMMVIGILLVLISRNLSSGKLVRNIIKIIIIIVIVLLVLKTLSGMEIFSGINQRMEYLVAMFTGKGEIGNSAMLRQQLIDLGIEMFKKHPILGIGIGCPHIIAGQVLNFDAYLHNNFVEVLAGGGIIGFLLYYGAYGYLIVKFYKLRKMGTKIYSLCIILLLICLFREYAMVSIYNKSTYFYFMIYFMEVDKLKQIKRRKTNVVISR